MATTSNFVSIADCPLCPRIPQKNSGSSLHDDPWPAEAQQLRELGSSLRKCPHCATCYHYDENFDPGEPMVMSETTYSLVRLTPHQARKALSGDELHEFEQRYDETIAGYQAALQRQGLTWHLKKFLVESLSDHFLAEKDWDSMRTILLDHPDPVVGVETASDLIYMATEEYPVWTIRYFSKDLQALAQDPVCQEQSALAARIIPVLVDGLARQDAAMQLDATLGYRATAIANTAYWGLANAVSRGMDIAAAVPALVGWLADDNKWKQEHAASDLKQYVGENPARARLVLDELARHGASRRKALQAMRRHCKDCLKQPKEAG